MPDAPLVARVTYIDDQTSEVVMPKKILFIMYDQLRFDYPGCTDRPPQY